jgi:hypothetical protein
VGDFEIEPEPSVIAFRSVPKMARTTVGWSAVTVVDQFVPSAAPDHDMNVQPGSGVAVSVTTVLLGDSAIVTVPPPIVSSVRGCLMKTVTGSLSTMLPLSRFVTMTRIVVVLVIVNGPV